MNFVYEILIPFILGGLFYLIIEYLTFKYSKIENGIIFTENISDNEITFTRDYQNILISRLGNYNDYFITYGNTLYHIISADWTIFDIKFWLDSLNKQDYAVTIGIVTKTFEGLLIDAPFSKINKEFIVNNQSNPTIISTFIVNGLESSYKELDPEIRNNHYIIIRYTSLTKSN